MSPDEWNQEARAAEHAMTEWDWAEYDDPRTYRDSYSGTERHGW